MTIFRALLYVEDFTDTDVALVVVETIQSQMAFADVVETGCMFTRHLTRQDQKQSKQMKSKLAELGLLDTLLDMSQCHCSCPLLLEAACGAIANIYLDESGEEEEGLPRPTTAPWAPVFDASYTRSVVIITKIITMNMNHVSVLRESCRALAAMSPCFLFLSPQGQSQVWDALEGAVRTQMSDADLAVMGVIAVGNLSTHSSGECKRKGDVCGIVVSVLRSHITDLAVARVACVTLSTIFTSIAANEPTLVHMGISELLVAVLQLHVTDETLVYRAFRCISNLLSYHPETVTSLAAADVVEVLIPALASYTSSCGVTVAGGGAIAVLARHELMTARLALTNVTELLLLALSTHSTAPVVVQSMLLALGNLFAMGKNFAESQELETSGVESLLSIFSIHAHSESIIIAAFWTIRHIVTVKGVGVICGEHRSLEAMLSTWSNHHKGSVVVARAAYWTLAAVFLHSTITDRVATESGVYDTLLGSMQCFTSDQEAMHAGCWALANYLYSTMSLGSGLESESEPHYLTSTASTSTSTSTFLHSTPVNMNESWELIASILEGHGSCPNTVEAACIAARNLYTSFASSTFTSSTPESFAPIVSSIGIAGSRNILSILATAVSQHISHPDTVKSVCDLLPILIIRMDNIQSPSDCGLLEAFSSLLSMYAASNPDIAAKALHALSALLTQYYDDNTSLSSSSSSSAVIALPKGLCRAVMNALQTNIGISNVTRPAYCVLQRLYKGGSRGRGRGDCCDRNSNMDCDSDYGSCDELIHNGILATLADVIGSSQRVMKEGGDVDVGIEEAMLWFLGNVLQHLVNTELEERDCITVVELAVTALQHQHHSRGASSGVVRAACRVIRYVKIPHNADKQTFLDQLSCSRIIEAIHNNASDLDVAESGCWAIANLAASTNSQRDVVLAAGAREYVSSVWTRHESVVEVAASACHALRAMTRHSHSQSHSNHGDTDADNNRESDNHSDETCKLSLSLSLSPVEMGLIVHCLTMHCTVLDVAQECCDFIRELLTSDARDNVSPDNGNDNIRLVLGEQGVCEALVSAVKSHVNDDRVVRSACQAMGQLCAEPTLRRLFARLRSQITLIGGVIAHLARVDVVEFALWTLRNMDYDCDYDHRDSQLCNDNKDLFQGIASVALFHARNEIIIESVCWLIHVIALARAVFKNKGCGLCLCETIITALRNHSQSAVVVISGCSAVMALAMNNDDHQAELCRLGARAMLQSLSVDSSEAMTVRDRAAASLSTMSTATDVMAALRNSDVVVAGQALDWIPMVLRVRGRGEQEVSLEKMMGVEGVLTELLRKEMASDEICAKVFLATRTLCHSQSSADRDGDIAGTGAGVFEEDDIVLKFVQAGMCTLVGTVIMLHMDKPMVVETGCETCIVLASDGRYADHFGTEGCEAMVCALGVHMANLGVARSANQAIANLARSPKTCDVLGETGACEAAVGTLTSHLPQWEVVEASSHAIATLSENSTNNVKLGYCGACAAIVSALITHWDIIPVVERCLSAIQNLSKDNIRNMESLRAVHINDAILTAWKTHINHVAVSEAACGAFLAVLPQNTDQKLKMIAMAANELLHVLSQSQSPESPFIRANVRSLRIIAHKSLPIGDVVNSLKLAAPTTASTSSSLTSILTSSFSSTCPDTSWDQIMLIIPIAVIGDESRTRQLAKCDGVARNMSKLLGQHFQTKTFCRHALKAINVLFGYGASLDIISTLGGDTGVCKSIVSILKYHCSVPEIIREVNWTILNLSSIPVLVSELGEAGVCRALVECLRLHLDDSATMESLCCAMHALDNDEKNMIHFMESDACPLLLTVLSKSPSSPTALEHVCQIIQQLSCIDHVTNELRKAETCYTLISALDIHRSMNVVTAAICRTIACIYQRTPDDPGLDPKALTTLVQFISVHVSVPDIAEAGCVVLHAIQMTTGKGLDADGLIVGQIISSALSTHVDVAVARQALLLMSVFQSPDELVFLMESGMCEAIVHAMSVLIREADVIESICVMIGNLAWNDVCVDCLGSVGACEALVAAMRMYISDARLVECMCAAMVRLSENNHVNRNRLLDAGADELLRSCFGYITSNRLHSSYIQLAFRNLMSVQYLVELLQYAASGVGTPNSDFVDGVLMTVTQGIVREYAQNQNIQLLQSVDIITTSILEIVKTSTRSASICKSAFASIAAISEIDVVRVALRKGHAFTVTAAALTSHIRHLNTVEEGCRAIRCLAIIRGKGRDNGNDIAGHHAGNNELLFGGSGGEDQINSACEAILLALTTYVTTCSVAEHGCLALADLIRCKGRVKLREGVYLDAIMMVLTTHASQPSVVAAAYTSLGHLCAVNGSHVQVNAVACVRIASSLSLYESTPAVLEAVVWAIRNLSECSSVNRAKLGEEGVCGSLVTLLDANTCHIELGKEICHAIQVHALDKISLNRLFTAGVGRAVANFMTCHPSCSDLALIGCRTIRSLVLSNTPPPIALPLDVEEVFAAVSIAIDIHIHIPELAITCCHILVSLSNLDDIHHLDHHSSDDFSCRTKACRIILAILSHHISVTEVVETVFSAICTLVALPHCSEVFKEGRVWELIITAMNAHIRGSASLLGKGCGALLIVVDAMHVDVYDAVGVGGGVTLRTIALATGIDTYTDNDNDNGAGIGSGNDTIDMCATVRILAEEILQYTCLIHDTVMTIVSKDVSSGDEQSVVDVLSRIPAMVLREKDTHMSLGRVDGFASGFVQVLSAHRSSEPLVMKGLTALRYLCGDSDGSSASVNVSVRNIVKNRNRCQRSAELLCEAGVCGVVVMLLEEHRNSSDVVKEVCHVMEVFTSFRNKEHFFDVTTSSYLINALSQHLTGNNNNNDMMMEWGCRAINALIIEDSSNNGNGYDHDFDHRRQLLTAGADGILRTYFLNKLNSTRLNHVIKKCFQRLVTVQEVADLIQHATNNASDAFTMQKAFLSICLCVTGSKERQSVLGNAEGAVENVVTLLKRCIATGKSCVFALNAVSALCGLDLLESESHTNPISTALCEENAITLGAAGACKTVVMSLVSFVKDPEVTQAACKAVLSLSTSSRNRDKLTNAGVCAAVVSALMEHQTSEQMVVTGCRTLSCLVAMDDAFKESMREAGPWEVLILLAQRPWTDLNPLKACLDAIAAIASSGCDLTAGLRNKVCTVVMQALWTNVKEAIVVEKSCTALRHLAQIAHPSQVGWCVGESAVIVVGTILEYINIIAVSEAVCRLVTALITTNFPVNAIDLTEAGVCEAIGICFTTNIHSALVVEAACGTVCQLCVLNGHSARLRRCGLTMATVTALKHHMSSTSVVNAGCLALSVLAAEDSDDETVTSFIACETAVLCIMTHMSHTKVVSSASLAVSHLAARRGNATHLGEVCACEAVVSGLLVHIDCPEVVEAGCKAVINIARSSVLNLEKFVAVGVEDVLRTVSCSPMLSERQWHIVSSAYQLVMTVSKVMVIMDAAIEAQSDVKLMEMALVSIPLVVGRDQSRHRELCGMGGVVWGITQLLKRSLSADNTLCVKALVVVKLLCEQHSGEEDEDCTRSRSSDSSVLNGEYNVNDVDNDNAVRRQLLLGESGTCVVVVRALETHMGNPLVVLPACRTLMELSFADPKTMSSFADMSYGPLVEALSRHMVISGVVEAVCVAITNISISVIKYQNNSLQVHEERVCISVVAVLNIHMKSLVVVRAALRAMAELSITVGGATHCVTAGAVPMVIRAVSEHITNAEVAEAGCRIIANFAGRVVNGTGQLWGHKAEDCVAAAMAIHVDVTKVAAAGILALQCLSKPPPSR